MKSLEIAKDLTLPLDAVTQKLAMMGRTGSGKTYGASKLAEEMLALNAQVVVLDPVGVWYGLRLAADGKGQGVSIPVFGGLHGDLPLEPTSGALVADLIVDRNISLVIDLSQFEHDTDKAKFGRDFAARFFFRKKSSPSAVHVFLEECQEFIPERPQKGEEHMLHNFGRMWKLGRNFGIGGTLISQRPQEVSKRALNLTECVFAFQLTGPHERKALEGWIAEKGVDEDTGALLPKLSIGEARVWSPSWLRISQTVKIAKKWTFNASSTPTVGQKSDARILAPIDLERIRKDMAATIERAKAEDPKELRRRIAELERVAQQKSAAPLFDPEQIKASEERGYDRGYAEGWRKGQDYIAEHWGKADDQLREASRLMGVAFVGAIRTQPQMTTAPVVRNALVKPSAIVRTRAATAVESMVGESGLKRMLIALAQRPQGMNAKQLGVRSALASSSGTFGTYLGKARSSGWIEGDKGCLVITDAGVAALGEYEPLPTGAALLSHWLRELGDSGASRMLEILAEAYPKSMTADQLGERAGLAASSGTFGTYLGKLRTLELIEGKRDALRASEEFFN